MVTLLAIDLLLILTAGLGAGVVCKRLGVSMLVGYLVVGAVIGHGGLDLMGHGEQSAVVENGDATEDVSHASAGDHDLEHIAHAGALLLLFSIGIELSLAELVRLSRYFLIGGGIQMFLVTVPATLGCVLLGLDWRPSLLIGSAVALSSTVLVFKALEEWGQSATEHGRRAVGILLFQDVALVPLMLLVPLLAPGGSDEASVGTWAWLGLMSVLFVAAVLLVRLVIARWAVPLLAALRSVELMVLFAVIVLGSLCLAAWRVGLPPALGALAAGIVLGDNRLSSQIDALILPFRETFAAVFFVSLGMLMRFDVLLERPALVAVVLVGVLGLKTLAAGVALRGIGLRWTAALGMGLGLAQMGELSFVLLSQGVGLGVIDQETYNLMLFTALATLILTPQLFKITLKTTASGVGIEPDGDSQGDSTNGPIDRAIVVGLGPIGGRVTSQLEILGIDVCLIDLSPINLQPFAQQGFRTVQGDATDPAVLGRADVEHCRVAVITVPDDRITGQVVGAVRAQNPTCTILVRCRYQSNTAPIGRAGATHVVSEESEASGALLRLLDQIDPGKPSG